MNTNYIVGLADDERSLLQDVVKKLKGTGQEVKRANILLKADACGPGWTDAKIAEALDCRISGHSCVEAGKEMNKSHRDRTATSFLTWLRWSVVSFVIAAIPVRTR